MPRTVFFLVIDRVLLCLIDVTFDVLPLIAYLPPDARAFYRQRSHCPWRDLQKPGDFVNGKHALDNHAFLSSLRVSIRVIWG
jgi:hypothetical protein